MSFEEGNRCLAEGGAFFPPVEGPVAVSGELLEGPAGWLRVEELLAVVAGWSLPRSGMVCRARS